MKVAIYHNLRKGGALSLIKNLCEVLIKKNHTIEIFTTSKSPVINGTKNRIYKISNPKNSINEIFSFLPKLNLINKKIASDIDSAKFDLVLIFPCIHTQSPSLIRYIKNTKTIYIFTESKREFYEKTTYDYLSIRRIISRIIRLPIKIIDYQNCHKANTIVSISHYSSHILDTIYNKKSYIIPPGIKQIEPKKITYLNNHAFISIGQISKIKGHDFSINQLKKSKTEIKQFIIIGRETYEISYIKNLIKEVKFASIVHTEDEKYKLESLKKSSFFLANQIMEPFGLATLESIVDGVFVLGKNEGGTPEIVRHGISGFLYPTSHAVKSLDEVNSRKYISTYKNAIIDWIGTVDKILKIANNIY
jgi:glycosyltransferase involved in cell wall biosynthesis